MVEKITVGGSGNPNTPDSEKVKPKDTGATATQNADVAATVRAGREDKEDREEAAREADAKERKRREASEASDQPKYKEEEVDDLDILEAGGWLLNLLVRKGLVSRVEALLGAENEAEDKKKAREERRKRKEERKAEKAEAEEDDEK